jgi:thiamine-phosphate diphosphorylase
MREVRRTIETLQSALGTHNDHAIDLISIRVNPLPIDQLVQGPNSSNRQNEEFQQRLVYLASQIMVLKRKHQEHPLYNEYNVVINDVNNLYSAIEANVDGIHVKEKDVAQIPYIRSVFQGTNRTNPVIIGISAHSTSEALHHFEMYRPNYIFVGTCYMTQSHPEKGIHDLEGPELPGLVKRLILQHTMSKDNDAKLDRISPPIIYAIGGIEKNNCHEPVTYGADGVAVIRSVMQSADPARAVKEIKQSMYGVAPS